jgi:phosphatidylglycerol:prolipoprotein diacylglycerol transferase
MPAMLTYPDFDPVALSLGPLKIHWYGITYLVGFLGSYALLRLRIKKPGSGWNKDQLADLLFYVALGVVVGGRIGYMLFYDLPTFIHRPWSLFEVWDGGMSFHGGLLGVLAAIWLFARRYHKRYFDVVDFTAVVVPVGLGAGRIGNFINGELWGKITSLPWGMRLQCSEWRFSYYCDGATSGLSQPRQPSQLYEFLLEGVVLFAVLWIYSMKPRPRMAVAGLFGLLYGCFRFLVEFVRVPDAQLGYLAFGWVTMGQILSLPLIVAGIVLLVMAYRHKEFAGRD